MQAFGIEIKKTSKATCFFCPKPAGSWKLEIKTAEGVLVKPLCDECQNYVERMSNGESLYHLMKEAEEHE